MNLRVAIAAVALVLGACAGNGGTVRPMPSISPERSACSDHWVYRVAPAYPKAAAKRRQEGWVLFGFDLDGSGSARNIRILDAEPSGVFEDNAVASLSSTRFKPGVVESNCAYPIQFKLGEIAGKPWGTM